MTGRLKDRVAIVVGAGSSGPGWGNGKCTAVTFAREGAVNALTMAIASQYADKGIRCNAILPGLMHTPMIDFLAEQYARGETDHNQAYDKMIAIRDRASPTGKMGTGWDTANAALFLA